MAQAELRAGYVDWDRVTLEIMEDDTEISSLALR
jgi:hypothetical protein